jgi:hypothetical protein
MKLCTRASRNSEFVQPMFSTDPQRHSRHPLPFQTASHLSLVYTVLLDMILLLSTSIGLLHLQALRVPSIRVCASAARSTNSRPSISISTTLSILSHSIGIHWHSRSAASSSARRVARSSGRRRSRSSQSRNHTSISRLLLKVGVPWARITLSRECAWHPGVLVGKIPDRDANARGADGQACVDDVGIIDTLLCLRSG